MAEPDQNQIPQTTEQPAPKTPTPASAPVPKSVATKFRELVLGGKFGPVRIGISANFNSRIGPGLEANLPY